MLKGTIYIPDISGYTKFVGKTAISHSKHIIKELLELIINSNTVGFKTSSIEGDAVLFYKIGEPVSFKELWQQTESIFINFHRYLKEIESTRLCDCGACQTASNLTIKFVTHYGTIEEMEVMDFQSIMGEDVILAHRLLKNSIPDNEYLLLTEPYTSSQNKEEIESHCESSEEYENFGKVNLSYITLSSLHKKIKAYPNNTNIPENFQDDVVITINNDFNTVKSVLIDNQQKIHWVPGVKNIVEESPINRIASNHICEFSDKVIEFESAEKAENENAFFFVEEGKAGTILFRNEYLIEQKNNQTLLHYKLSNYKKKKRDNLLLQLVNKFKFFLFRLNFLPKHKRGLYNLKNYCESISN